MSPSECLFPNAQRTIYCVSGVQAKWLPTVTRVQEVGPGLKSWDAVGAEPLCHARPASSCISWTIHVILLCHLLPRSPQLPRGLPETCFSWGCFQFLFSLLHLEELNDLAHPHHFSTGPSYVSTCLALGDQVSVLTLGGSLRTGLNLFACVWHLIICPEKSSQLWPPSPVPS